MKIEHLALNVAEASKQAQWYVDHLEMRILREGNDPNQTHFIVDGGERVILELYTNPAAPIPDYAALSPFTLHIAFSVDDIYAERDRLIAAGAKPDGEITQTPAGDRLTFLRDPWGICIQLTLRQQPLLSLKTSS